MKNKSTPPHRYFFAIDPSNEFEQIPLLYDLENVLRGGNQDFADGWRFMLGEMESQIQAGWLNREDAAIERFDLCVEMTSGDIEWKVNVTMQPVLAVIAGHAA